MSPKPCTLHGFWLDETLNSVPDSEEDDSVFEDQTLEDLLAADLEATDCPAEGKHQPSTPPASIHGAQNPSLAEHGVRESTGAEDRTPPARLRAGEAPVEATQQGADDLPAEEALDDTPAPSATCTHQVQKSVCCRNAHDHGVVPATPSPPPPGCPASGTTAPPSVSPLDSPSSLLPARRESQTAPAQHRLSPSRHKTPRARPIWAEMHALLSKPMRYGATHPALLSERFTCHRVKAVAQKDAAQTSEWASTVALLRREVRLKKRIDLLAVEMRNGRSWDEKAEKLREGEECVRELGAVQGVLDNGGNRSGVVLRDRVLGGCRVRCVGVREGNNDRVGM